MSNKKKSILIVVIAGIGDFVLSSKSIRAVRKGWPNDDIHILTSTEAAPIACNYGLVDRVWAFPIRQLRKNKFLIFKIIRLIFHLRKIKFDIIVNLYQIGSWFGAFKMGLLFLTLKASKKIGHNNRGFGIFVHKKLPSETFKNKHFADAMLDLAMLAGGKFDDKGLEVYWSKNSEETWESMLSERTQELSGFKIGLNPGGDRDNRRWSPDKFATVADSLVEKFNAKIIILGGPGEEKIARRIQDKMFYDSINLAGKLTVNELVYFISRFDLLITNDSGPMHISAAVKTPTVAIFGPENVKLLKPYTESNYYRTVYKDLDCRPCSKSKCNKPSCLESIKAADVFEKCQELIAIHNV